MAGNQPKVRVLLDVDGVLNAVHRNPDPDQWPDWEQAQAQGFIIRFSPTVGRTIRRWAETPGVEVLWLTTWEDLANEHICPMLDLPLLAVAGGQDYSTKASGLLVAKSSWWKLPHARRLYEDDSVPFVWLDDDLQYERDAHMWLATLDDVEPRPYLAIAPDTERGLTQGLLDRVDEFITGWTS